MLYYSRMHTEVVLLSISIINQRVKSKNIFYVLIVGLWFRILLSRDIHSIMKHVGLDPVELETEVFLAQPCGKADDLGKVEHGEIEFFSGLLPD